MKHKFTKGKKVIKKLFDKHIPNAHIDVCKNKEGFIRIIKYCVKEKTRISKEWYAYP